MLLVFTTQFTIYLQITTHSKLMSDADRHLMENQLPFLAGKVSLLSLQAFDTEQQFSCQIRLIEMHIYPLTILTNT